MNVGRVILNILGEQILYHIMLPYNVILRLIFTLQIKIPPRLSCFYSSFSDISSQLYDINRKSDTGFTNFPMLSFIWWVNWNLKSCISGSKTCFGHVFRQISFLENALGLKRLPISSLCVAVFDHRSSPTLSPECHSPAVIGSVPLYDRSSSGPNRGHRDRQTLCLQSAGGGAHSGPAELALSQGHLWDTR